MNPNCGIRAAELQAALPGLIVDDDERAAVEAAITAALAASPGSGWEAIRTALESHAETRKWLRRHLTLEIERAIDIPGDPTAALGVLFVCPQEDYDFVRETVNQKVPSCPVHHVELVRAVG